MEDCDVGTYGLAIQVIARGAYLPETAGVGKCRSFENRRSNACDDEDGKELWLRNVPRKDQIAKDSSLDVHARLRKNHNPAKTNPTEAITPTTERRTPRSFACPEAGGEYHCCPEKRLARGFRSCVIAASLLRSMTLGPGRDLRLRGTSGDPGAYNVFCPGAPGLPTRLKLSRNWAGNV